MNALRNWLGNFRGDLTGPYSYRVWGVIIATLVGAYVGLHTVFEARHGRQMNESLFERDVFTTLVSSGVRGDFIAGMKDFGRIQRMSIRSAPGLWNPLGWWKREQPNMDPLWRWADNRLEWCENSLCGTPRAYRIVLKEANLQKTRLKGVDLNESDLRDADLSCADLQGIDLEGADLQGANLREAKLQGANLREAKLQEASLREANLQEASLREANLQEASLREAKLQEASLREANLQGANLREAKLQEASLREADLRGADLRGADLRGTEGINCAQLKQAMNWEKAFRDEVLTCAAEIPELDELLAIPVNPDC